MGAPIQGTGGNQPIDPSSIHVATPQGQLDALSREYQIHSGIEILHTLRNQIEQLEAARSGGQPNDAAQGIAHDLLSTEVSSLLHMVNMLKNQPLMIGSSNDGQGTVTAAQSTHITNELNSLSAQLTRMHTTLQGGPDAQLPASDINALSGMLSTLNTLSENFPKLIQSNYWESQTTMFQTLMSSSQLVQQTVASPASLQSLLTMATLINHASQDSALTGAGVVSITNELANIAHIQTMSPSQREFYLSQLNSMEGHVSFQMYDPDTGVGTNATLGEAAARTLVYTWAQEYITSHPEGSLTSFINGKLSSLVEGINLHDNPSMNAIHSAVEQLVATPSGGGESFASTIHDFIVANPSAPVAAALSLGGSQLVGIGAKSEPPPSAADITANAEIRWLTGTTAHLRAGEAIDPTISGPMMSAVASLIHNYHSLSPAMQTEAQHLFTSMQGVSFERGGNTFTFDQMAASAWLTSQSQRLVADGTLQPTGTPPQGRLLFSQDELGTALRTEANGLDLPAALQDAITNMLGTSNTDPKFTNQTTGFASLFTANGAFDIGQLDGANLSVQSDFKSAGFFTGMSVANGSTFTTPTFAPSPTNINTAPIQQRVTQATQDAAALQGLENAFNTTTTALNSAAIASAVQGAQVDKAGGSSLQDYFASVILDHYMPGQQQYLEQTAQQLNFSNWAANAYNNLISTTKGFTGASSVIDFASSIGNPANGPSAPDILGITLVPTQGIQTTAYQGSVASARTQLTQEKTNVDQNLSHTGEAITQVQNLLDSLKPPGTSGANGTAAFLNNPQLKSQIATLVQDLTKQLDNLKTAQASLTNLQAFLQNVQVTDPPTSISFAFPDDPTKPVENNQDTHWTPASYYSLTYAGQPMTSAQITQFGQLENNVVNGTVDGQGSSTSPGISQLAQSFSTDSQNFANQSQTQQMQMQLVMTQIQQEWTIVSTALSILNQVYLTVAKNISSG